jgi:putative oxidoreductase
MSQYWKRMISSQWLLLGARVYLGLLFIIASWHKIIHPETFTLDVATYQFLPLWAINGFALVLPWVELLAGAMLILGLRARAAALLVLLMMLSFIVALLWALHLGLDMACGCFASQAATTDDPISSHTLFRDLFWFLLALYVLVFEKAALGFDRIFSTGRLRDS